MKKIIKFLQIGIKKITTSKTNIQIVLLTVILLVVSIPYLNQLRIKAIEWKVEQQRIQENQVRIKEYQKKQERKQAVIKQQEVLLTKYNITSLTLDNSDTKDFDYPVYRFPDWVFTHIKTFKILDTQKPYTCDNLPPTPSPTPKQFSYFDIDFEKLHSSSKKDKREQFIADCESIKKNENQYQRFQKDIVLVKDLIRDNNSPEEEVISKLVSSLRTDLQKYNDLIEEGNGYIKVNPLSVTRSGEVTLEYGYKDLTNNEHLTSAISTVTIETPSKKKYTAIDARVYPDDFPGATTLESGTYWVFVERTIKTTSGSEDVLYSASSMFFVTEN